MSKIENEISTKINNNYIKDNQSKEQITLKMK